MTQLEYCSTTESARRLMVEGSLALADMEESGMRIDAPYFRKLDRDIQVKMAALIKKMNAEPEGVLGKKLFGSKWEPSNAGQLGNVFAKMKKGDVVLSEKTGKPLSNKTVLESMDSPFIDMLQEYRRYEKASNTYIAQYLREEVDGCVHPIFNLHTVRTFRSSADSPNPQNAPVRDENLMRMIRRGIIAEDGNQLVEVDYKGNEVCCACCYCKDQKLIDDVIAGDMHRDLAMALYILEKMQVTDKSRYSAKNGFVFPEFYGSWWLNCAEELWKNISRLKLKLPDGTPMKKHLASKGITKLGDVELSRRGLERGEKPPKGTFLRHVMEVEFDFWHVRFKVYDQWRRDWFQEYLRKGYFDMLTGFRCSGLMDRKEVINYPIQGSAFHCLLWSVIKVRKYLRKHRCLSMMIGETHDSILFDMNPKERDDIIPAVRKIMTQDIREEWKWMIMPMEIDVKASPVGGTWADLEKVKGTP